MAKKKHLGVFVAVVWSHWEARFGTTFAVMVAVAQYVYLAFGDPNKLPKWVKEFPPSLWLAIGGLLLFWACYAAWHKERTEAMETEAKLDATRKELADRRPRITLEVLSPAGADWFIYEDSSNMPLFYLKHYGGDGARGVKVGPIASPSGRRLLWFDPVNLVSGPVPNHIPFWVATRERDSTIRKTEKSQRVNTLLYFFLADNPEGTSCIRYLVPIEFQWEDKTIHEDCELHYDTERRYLSVHPTQVTPQ